MENKLRGDEKLNKLTQKASTYAPAKFNCPELFEPKPNMKSKRTNEPDQWSRWASWVRVGPQPKLQGISIIFESFHSK